MYGKTFAALATLFTVVGATAPSALAACTTDGCNSINLDINVDAPKNFGFATSNGDFSATVGGDASDTSGESTAQGIAARGGQAEGSNTTTVNGEAANGAKSDGSSSSDVSVAGSGSDDDSDDATTAGTSTTDDTTVNVNGD